jgi:molecular chaperone GrpE
VQALELASGAADQDLAAVRDGIALVARSLQKVFDRHGLARIPVQGVPFDPTLHEAVLTENVEGAARGTVVREVSPGFRTEEQVIRPAKVSVAA